MRTVEDRDGDRYVLLKESAEASRVRDPATGEVTHIENDAWEHVEGASLLVTAAAAVPEPVRDVLTAVPDERALGLLVDLDERGPLGVRALLSADLCESDLHGLLAEFRAAGLVEEVAVGGERGYDTTDLAERGLETLRSA